MTLSDGVREPIYGRPPEGAAVPASLRLSRRWRAGLSCALAAVALAGCGLSESPGQFAVDPGRYEAYHCNDLVTQWKALRMREDELRGLMEKASEGGGGAVIGSLAYRTDYETVLSDEKLLRRTAAEKKCELGSSTYQSDQTIR